MIPRRILVLSLLAALALPVLAPDLVGHDLVNRDLIGHDLPGSERDRLPPPHRIAQADWDPQEDWAPEFHDLDHKGADILPLKRAVQIVEQRFRGRLIAARLVPPRPRERARGVVLVHQLRLLTPARDVLAIRLDAQTGAFLEVAGAGITKARRKASSP